VVKYTAKVLIPFILVGVDALLFFPLIGVSVLIQNFCLKKQEIQDGRLK